MTSLREDVARIVDPQAWNDLARVKSEGGPWGEYSGQYWIDESTAKADAIIQAITSRLLREEAVEAGYDATRLSDGSPQFADAGFCMGHAAKIIAAALESIAHDQ